METTEASNPTTSTSIEAAPRLTMAYLLKQGLRKFLSIEQGWVNTAVGLTRSPGTMLKEYIAGNRSAYMHPLSYLVLNSLMVFFAMQLFNLQEMLMSSDNYDFGASVTPMQIRSQAETSGFAFQNNNLTYIGLVIPLAFFLRWFFRKTGYNLAEMSVVALYTVSHAGLISILVMPVLLIWDLNALDYTIIGLSVSLSFFLYAAWSFFNRSIWAGIKTCFAYLFAYVTFIIIFSTVIVVFQLLVRNEIQNRESWHMDNTIELDQATKLRQLLAEGWDPNTTAGFSPLHQTVLQQRTNLMSHLVAFGADLEARDFQNNTPLLLALERQNWEAVNELVSLGASATPISDRGASVLIEALRLDNRELAFWAIENGVDVNAYAKDESRGTALILAAADDDLEMVQRLLDAGADPDMENRNGRTALDYADEQSVIDLLATVTTPAAPDSTQIGSVE